jgi:hypothetical protein
MKVVLRVGFVSTANNTYWGSAYREIQADFAPSIDIAFELPPFIDAKAPKTISFVVEDNCFSVYLGDEKHKTKDDCQARAEEFRSFGWNVSGQ